MWEALLLELGVCVVARLLNTYWLDCPGFLIAWLGQWHELDRQHCRLHLPLARTSLSPWFRIDSLALPSSSSLLGTPPFPVSCKMATYFWDLSLHRLTFKTADCTKKSMVWNQHGLEMGCPGKHVASLLHLLLGNRIGSNEEEWPPSISNTHLVATLTRGCCNLLTFVLRS